MFEFRNSILSWNPDLFLPISPFRIWRFFFICLISFVRIVAFGLFRGFHFLSSWEEIRYFRPSKKIVFDFHFLSKFHQIQVNLLLFSVVYTEFTLRGVFQSLKNCYCSLGSSRLQIRVFWWCQCVCLIIKPFYLETFKEV